MSSTQKVIAFSTVGVLGLALIGTSAYLASDHFDSDGNPNTTKVTSEQRAEAEYARQASFDLIAEDAVMISHTNVEALTDEARSQWWDWYQKMLPPGFTSFNDISGLEGVESITLSVAPNHDAEYSEISPLYYNVLFTTSDDEASDVFDAIRGEVGTDDLSYAQLRTPGNGKSVIALTSITGLSESDKIFNEDTESFAPNDDWFPVDAEPTMYVDASGYLDSMMTAAGANSDEEFSETARMVMESAFGFTDETGFTWLGRSSDFGVTWESDEVSDVESISAESVSADRIVAMQSDALDAIMDESVMQSEQTDDVETASGITDSMGVLSVLDAVSVRSSNGTVVGGALDPYSTDATTTEAPEVANEGGFALVFSPIMWQSTFQGMINPSHVQTVTAQVDADGNSSLSFDFYEEGEEGYVG